VVANSLIRLLGNYESEKKTEVLLQALNSKSELVRSSAAYGLAGVFTDEVKNALLNACQDEIRLVRIQAANAIIGFQESSFTAEQKSVIELAENEYVVSITSRLDDWSSHYNLGIYHQNKGNVQAALNSYETAARLYPQSLIPLINSSVLYSLSGNQGNAEANLKKVLEFDPENEAANLNLGLLLAEQGRLAEAEKMLRIALKSSQEANPVAAKNLSVIEGQKGNFGEAVKYAEMAAVARPENPDYGYTLAYYQMQNGQKAVAIKTLTGLIKSHPQFVSASSFLADIYLRDGNKNMALQIYKDALKVDGISDDDKAAIQQTILSLQ
jgi:tetratricopeptide (TPR) repeat protein